MMSEILLVHVIDDDDAVRDGLAELFASVDLETRTYASAAEFLAILDTGPLGCIVTDLQMPEMTGLDLLSHLRAVGVDLPVIVISGALDRARGEEAMRRGAAHFFDKPVDDDALLAAVAAVMPQVR
ncbi:MAG: fixJ [Phenylobacterium sp.]|nr:fixJ [Phenylobacterium sp.]